MVNGGPGSNLESFPLARRNPQIPKDLNTVSMVFDNGSRRLFLLDHRVLILVGNIDIRLIWKSMNSYQMLYLVESKVAMAKVSISFIWQSFHSEEINVK